MNNGDMPAAPTWELNGQGVNEMTGDGLTKREAFAMAAMQGNMAARGVKWVEVDVDYMASIAVEMADALLAELEATNER